jgi:arylsulfatase A-like enzyme
VRRLGAVDVLVLSLGCGLAAGELEVAVRILQRALSSTHRLYMMTRHFLWLVPMINLALFLGLGLVLAGATRLWPQRAGRWSPRLILATALLPALALAGRPIYLEAWLLVALGVALRIAPLLERHPARWRRWLVGSVPVLLGLVLIQAGWIFGGDRLKQWREDGRRLPPAGSPNVLLIVLDTVRADHLSLYGYPRPTTTTLDRLAARGIRFDEARASAPWTLASHASFFTGRWPHELGVQWLAPLKGNFTTSAEYLGAHGYATAGFVSNAGYCSYDTGLDRGFTHYEDYVLERLGSLRTASLVDAVVKTFGDLTRPLDCGWFHRLRATVGDWFFSDERKSAQWINRDFLHWFAQRQAPGRPFFVFLNYLDTHTPYLLPPGARHRFGVNPATKKNYVEALMDWRSVDKHSLPRRYSILARDAYDNCVAYLDDQLGALFDEMQRRGILDRTLVITTSDHGEGLGEHDLFIHGESLYRTEIHVPLLILTPSQRPSAAVVRETVSLRDLPATVVDLIGLAQGSPFPGRSLARLWAEPPAADPPAQTEGVLSELAAPNPSNPNQGRSPAYRGPLISLAEGDFVYIRNEGDGSEELFNQRDDPNEVVNLARAEAMLPVLRRFRDHLVRAKAHARAIQDPGTSPGVATAVHGTESRVEIYLKVLNFLAVASALALAALVATLSRIVWARVFHLSASTGRCIFSIKAEKRSATWARSMFSSGFDLS